VHVCLTWKSLNSTNLYSTPLPPDFLLSFSTGTSNHVQVQSCRCVLDDVKRLDLRAAAPALATAASLKVRAVKLAARLAAAPGAHGLHTAGASPKSSGGGGGDGGGGGAAAPVGMAVLLASAPRFSFEASAAALYPWLPPPPEDASTFGGSGGGGGGGVGDGDAAKQLMALLAKSLKSVATAAAPCQGSSKSGGGGGLARLKGLGKKVISARAGTDAREAAYY